ncbi:Piso0_003904 [Millerozyma farinosa CBS 7064]|uniref:Piso0_003904 protein n=1 Tax=Pichia sorbitophila (strain ATCC MYA-4447 / BCRC 22081 / CBS 7064 / NBRC 10061 / NRRL Y-12695) TaxID=559304 RepID=G8Y9U6_PICSO|nr:Piso0_003904 [Millerozyma farinosa CBS 7064]CCE84360.1 Piso0_003904 [Millerozyma farinosa CBS 7064]
MHTPKKGIVERAVSSIFGPSTPLTNEPTIDYNDTIASTAGTSRYTARRDDLRASMDTRSVGGERFPRRGRSGSGSGAFAAPSGRTAVPDAANSVGASRRPAAGYVVEPDQFDDSDDELHGDLEYVFQRYNDTGEIMRGLDARTHGDRPHGYPSAGDSLAGDLHRASAATGPRQRPERSPAGRYAAASLGAARRARDPAARSGAGGISVTHSDSAADSLENDIHVAALNAHRNSAPFKQGADASQNCESEVKQLLRGNTAALADLADFVNLNDPHALSADLQARYDALRDDYIRELRNTETFYKAYYKLVFKYRTLKKSVKQASSSTIRERIKSIRAASAHESIRADCDQLLADIDASDKLVAYYQSQLAAANARIADLELRLAEK